MLLAGVFGPNEVEATLLLAPLSITAQRRALAVNGGDYSLASIKVGAHHLFSPNVLGYSAKELLDCVQSLTPKLMKQGLGFASGYEDVEDNGVLGIQDISSALMKYLPRIFTNVQCAGFNYLY